MLISKYIAITVIKNLFSSKTSHQSNFPALSSMDFKFFEFLGDNFSGVDSRILAAINGANNDSNLTYGKDKITNNCIEYIKKHFGLKDSTVHFVLTGTAANTLAIKALLHSYESIIATEKSHLFLNECGSIENNTRSKVFGTASIDGKLDLSQLDLLLNHKHDFHYPSPKVITITQPTELGTVYSLEELVEISEFARSKNLLLHIDGARLSNAIVQMNIDFEMFFRVVKPAAVSFSGVKNGLMFGDLIIFNVKNESINNFNYIKTQELQMYSKMYFIAAQYHAFLKDGIWHDNAKNANESAQILKSQLMGAPSLFKIKYPVESNVVIAEILNEPIMKKLQLKYYNLNMPENVTRFMTSHNTKKQDINDFINYLKL